MNLVLLEEDSSASTVRLTGRQARHILEILKPCVGDTLRVGVLNGKVGTARVLEVDPGAIHLSIDLSDDPPAKIPVTVACALMRPLVLKRVLLTLSSLGVPEIHLFHSRRVEKSFWQSAVLREEGIRSEMILGLEQARDTVLPRVFLHKRFKPFTEDVLPGLLEGCQGIVADPGGERMHGIRHTPQERDSCVLIVGPEGGFIPYELEAFDRAGCRRVSLGERILRVETALVSLIAKLI
ncbi:MAG: 16S rRNA (uracil(1498)-N(3))-methyltransferase [Elusimicrobia bacterium]|nr:16S rRNA (uracil(1498)-N(3))-methyltransferase [Elusimicrobiota bacterium]